MPNHKLLIKEEDLRQWYEIEGLSAQSIAVKLGCSCLTILNRLRNFGIHVKSISEANNGKKRSDSAKLNYRASWTQERKTELSNRVSGENHPCFGMNRSGVAVHSKEHKLKLSKRMTGKNNHMYGRVGPANPNWVIPSLRKSSLDKQIRSCLVYKKWRSSVFARDNYICQICGDRGGKLQADHIKQFAVLLQENEIKCLEEAISCESLWDLTNGRALCETCHSKTDTYMKRIK